MLSAGHFWRRNGWNSVFRWHLFNLIIWKDLHSGVLTLTSKRSARPHVRGTLLSGNGWHHHPSLCIIRHQVVLWSDINIPAHTHTQICTCIQAGYHRQKEGCWCWNTCMDHWKGQLKRSLFQKTWYKRKDRGTKLNDKWTSHFNRHRDGAWPALTGVLSHSPRHDVAIVVATSTKRPAEIPHQTPTRAQACLGKHGSLLPSQTGAYIKRHANVTTKDYKQYFLALLHIKATLLLRVCFWFNFLGFQTCFFSKACSVHKTGLDPHQQKSFWATKRGH